MRLRVMAAALMAHYICGSYCICSRPDIDRREQRLWGDCNEEVAIL